MASCSALVVCGSLWYKIAEEVEAKGRGTLCGAEGQVELSLLAESAHVYSILVGAHTAWMAAWRAVWWLGDVQLQA
jgi:hypothetical protein